MKIRNGFVSNSSSSSFLIYGASFSSSDLNEDFFEKIKNHFIKKYSEEEYNKNIQEYIEDEEYHINWGELMYYILKNYKQYFTSTLLDYHCLDDDTLFIGVSPSDVKDDSLTFEQYKNNVKNEIKDLLGIDCECDWHEEVLWI